MREREKGYIFPAVNGLKKGIFKWPNETVALPPAHRDDAQVDILRQEWVCTGALQEAEIGVERFHNLIDLLHGVHRLHPTGDHHWAAWVTKYQHQHHFLFSGSDSPSSKSQLLVTWSTKLHKHLSNTLPATVEEQRSAWWVPALDHGKCRLPSSPNIIV